MKILFIGPPASGKGTMSRMLSKELDLPLINTGELLREVPKDSIWYQPIHEAMDKGFLAPNSIVGGMLQEHTDDSRYEKGYILDGWVRQLSDLAHFDPQPDKVIYLKISKETSKERIIHRRVCEKNGHTFNLVSLPPQKNGICDFDGSKLIRRGDDNKDVFEKRYREFENKTLSVIEFYRKQGKVVEINGERTPEEVFTKILEELKE
jgi:adenylate kinase